MLLLEGSTASLRTAKMDLDHSSDPVDAAQYDAFGDDYIAYVQNGAVNAAVERALVLDLLGNVEGHTVIDAGCRSGPLARELRRRVRQSPGSTQAGSCSGALLPWRKATRVSTSRARPYATVAFWRRLFRLHRGELCHALRGRLVARSR
jgi:hypothetical protein